MFKKTNNEVEMTEPKTSIGRFFHSLYLRMRHRGHDESYYYNEDGSPKFDVNRPLESKKRSFYMNQNLLAFLVLIPAFILIVLFMIYPIINSFVIAFTEGFTWVDGGGSFAISNIILGNSQVCEDMSAVGGSGIVCTDAPYPSNFGFGNFAYLFSDTTYSISLFGQTIPTSFGQTLSWKYWEYAANNPVTQWKVPTKILYAGKDHLTDRDTVEAFAKTYHCELTIWEPGEHWFHTQPQLDILYSWIDNNIQSGKVQTKFKEVKIER